MPTNSPACVFAQEKEWWANTFRLNPWAKGCADRDYYLFVMVDVISCRYRMEGPWFIALSTATSRTCALACRMNTALSLLSIHHRHLSPAAASLSLPFHATIHKQSFIILIHSYPYFFSELSVRSQFYVSHYFDAVAGAAHLGVITKGPASS